MPLPLERSDNPPMVDPTVIRHDRYYLYAELTAALETLVAAHPSLARLYSIGRTFGGRDIWVVEITNPATGPAEHKPGFYIDAHIHAEEHVTSSVALHAAWYLLSRYGLDEEVTRLVDGQVFYILPRLNPDGAELSLRPPYHRWVGNGRFQPGQERERGIIPQDLNDDGYIVHMRVPDPLGEWKKSARDPRLLVQRDLPCGRRWESTCRAEPRCERALRSVPMAARAGCRGRTVRRVRRGRSSS